MNNFFPTDLMAHTLSFLAPIKTLKDFANSFEMIIIDQKQPHPNEPLVGKYVPSNIKGYSISYLFERFMDYITVAKICKEYDEYIALLFNDFKIENFQFMMLYEHISTYIEIFKYKNHNFSANSTFHKKLTLRRYCYLKDIFDDEDFLPSNIIKHEHNLTIDWYEIRYYNDIINFAPIYSLKQFANNFDMIVKLKETRSEYLSGECVPIFFESQTVNEVFNMFMQYITYCQTHNIDISYIFDNIVLDKFLQIKNYIKYMDTKILDKEYKKDLGRIIRFQRSSYKYIKLVPSKIKHLEYLRDEEEYRRHADEY